MRWLSGILLLLAPFVAQAETNGKQGLSEIKQCIMQNDAALCHQSMTAASYPVFDKFSDYKLLPCLPTDFTYKSERTANNQTIVTALLPADNKTDYSFRMIFVKDAGRVKLDLPQTLQLGLGPKWLEKLNFSEQLFLMLRQNMQDKLTCNVLQGMVVPQKN